MQRKFFSLFFVLVITGFYLYAHEVQLDQTDSDTQEITQQVVDEKQQPVEVEENVEVQRRQHTRAVRAQVDPTILSCIAEAIVLKYCVLG